MRRSRISASVVTDDPSILQRAVEALSRAAAGLAMEDIDALVIVTEDE